MGVDLGALGNGQFSRFRNQVRKLCLGMSIFLGKESVFHQILNEVETLQNKSHFLICLATSQHPVFVLRVASTLERSRKYSRGP